MPIKEFKVFFKMKIAITFTLIFISLQGYCVEKKTFSTDTALLNLIKTTLLEPHETFLIINKAQVDSADMRKISLKNYLFNNNCKLPKNLMSFLETHYIVATYATVLILKNDTLVDLYNIQYDFDERPAKGFVVFKKSDIDAWELNKILLKKIFEKKMISSNRPIYHIVNFEDFTKEFLINHPFIISISNIKKKKPIYLTYKYNCG